ncbi:hypothetical protein BO79DRAFT_12764 [Aspergillus costaricaensis CBS 115574]|uniref:Uncharacterized protein n=1 Tax=Aspergillus costaricaensis CBS 115574 TaxID=1448317 RepID=A0ACD1IF30_9EURO|nr:hypothetical protein BO79DRAFT_12764 [Aspergillus costaricaensis CBS 115574]RAK89190.1 hypothetical protein BO79DRAFT_12764 [Aspergillus costaricaensis CBS 115574]
MLRSAWRNSKEGMWSVDPIVCPFARNATTMPWSRLIIQGCRLFPDVRQCLPPSDRSTSKSQAGLQDDCWPRVCSNPRDIQRHSNGSLSGRQPNASRHCVQGPVVQLASGATPKLSLLWKIAIRTG